VPPSLEPVVLRVWRIGASRSELFCPRSPFPPARGPALPSSFQHSLVARFKPLLPPQQRTIPRPGVTAACRGSQFLLTFVCFNSCLSLSNCLATKSPKRPSPSISISGSAVLPSFCRTPRVLQLFCFLNTHVSPRLQPAHPPHRRPVTDALPQFNPLSPP